MGLFNVGDVIFQAGDNSTEAGDKSGCICYLDASSMGRKKGQSTDRVVSNRSLLRSNINQEKPCMTVSTGPSNQGHRMLVVAWLLVFGSRLPCFVFWLRSRGLSLQLLHCCFFGDCACTFCLASVRRVWCLQLLGCSLSANYLLDLRLGSVCCFIFLTASRRRLMFGVCNCFVVPFPVTCLYLAFGL